MTLVVSANAFAGTITSISPSSIAVGSGEWFLTIDGSNLSGPSGAMVYYVGPAGSLQVAVSDATPTQVVAWVPQEVVNAAGDYNVSVRGLADPETPDSNVSGPVRLTITSGGGGGSAPTIGVPEAVVAEAASNSGANVTFSVTANAPFTCDHTSGALFPLGVTSVSCSATNSFGTSTAQFNVTVVDTTPPLLNVPDALFIAATSPQGAVATWSASAIDLVDGPVTPICIPASGSLFPIGKTTVDCVAADARQNQQVKEFDVTVTADGLDATPPSIKKVAATPSSISPANNQLVPVTITVDVTDNSSGPITTRITGVTADQVITTNDYTITGALTLNLRAARNPSTADRIYTITVMSQDASGNTSTATVQVRITQFARRRAVG